MLKEVLQKYAKHEDQLLEILLECQMIKSDHFISKEDITEIAKYLSIPESKVCSVLSFYTFFSDKPRGKYIIQVCKDIPCYISSDVDILRIIEQTCLLPISVNIFKFPFFNCSFIFDCGILSLISYFLRILSSIILML